MWFIQLDFFMYLGTTLLKDVQLKWKKYQFQKKYSFLFSL